MSNVFNDFTMAESHNMTNLDYMSRPLDFENGFGFSPATSPVREHAKQDYAGFFTNAMSDAMFLNGGDGELFSNYTQASPTFQSLAPPTSFPSINAKVVNGQVTPPSDNSPVTPKCEVDNEPSPVSLERMESKQAGRKKRASPASTTQSPNENPPKRRKSSARKSSMESLSEGEGKDEKRSKFLERNRVAASKCRQKKKEWTANLEQRARDLQQNKAHLNLLVSSLRDEVLYLKSEVLKHDHCNCTALRQYMSRAVPQISGEPVPSDKFDNETLDSPMPETDLDGMSFTGSPQSSTKSQSPAVKAET